MELRTRRAAGPLGRLITTVCCVALALVGTSPSAAAPSSPDLVVRSTSEPPGVRAPGGRLTLSVAVRNAGRQRARGSTVRFFLSRDRRLGRGDVSLAGSAGVRALAPGGSATSRARVEVPRATRSGVYRLLACADATRRVREASEANNCRPARRALLVDRPSRPRPLTVSPTLDPERTARADIGLAGGRMTATGADGTTFTLTIPARALPRTQAIAMTPLLGLSNMRMSGGLVAGIQLAPEGLRLLRKATLEIVPARPVPVTAQDGFAYSGSGREFRLYPVERPTPRIVLPIFHFSGYGIGNATPTDRAAIREYIPVNTEGQHEMTAGELFDAFRTGAISAEQLEAGMSELLVKAYFREVVPAFEEALAPRGEYSDGERAAHTLATWERTVELMGLGDHFDRRLGIGFPELKSQGRALLRQAIRRFFDQAIARCLAGVNVPLQVNRATGLARTASLIDDADAALGEDWEERLRRCREKGPIVWAGTVTFSHRRDYDPTQYTPVHYTHLAGRLDMTFEQSRHENYILRNPEGSFAIEYRNAGTDYQGRSFCLGGAASGRLERQGARQFARYARLTANLPGGQQDSFVPDGQAFLQTGNLGHQPSRLQGCSEQSLVPGDIPNCPPYEQSRPPGARGFVRGAGDRQAIDFSCSFTRRPPNASLTERVEIQGTLRQLR